MSANSFFFFHKLITQKLLWKWVHQKLASFPYLGLKIPSLFAFYKVSYAAQLLMLTAIAEFRSMALRNVSQGWIWCGENGNSISIFLTEGQRVWSPSHVVTSTAELGHTLFWDIQITVTWKWISGTSCCCTVVFHMNYACHWNYRTDADMQKSFLYWCNQQVTPSF